MEDATDRGISLTGGRRVQPTTEAKLPPQIGRYQVRRLLGQGGFGLVYLGHDATLQRLVAIKVPHPSRLATAHDAELYFKEARTVASLDHPHIVPVFDVGRAPGFPCFVVSKFVDGTNLASKLAERRLPCREAAALVATLAEALHYAHTQGMVHRDIKPGNILVDRRGQPFLVDFGLALREHEGDDESAYAGTPAYMSPEQVRGEGHRVDGRSDIFSLGVVFYEMLTGRRPFQGVSERGLLDEIGTCEPKPPRQITDAIPKEIERVCLRCLAKRASERYTTARDLADDLHHFLSEAPPVDIGEAVQQLSMPSDEHDRLSLMPATTLDATSAKDLIRIIPKGLRCFDEHDADFFLTLLPGPRDRFGLPDSVRFWKTRIEQFDAERTFTVGLLYGPSGCGKSSLIKAGLLPHLSPRIIALHIEATSDETEFRLRRALQKRLPGVDDGPGLKDILSALRRGHGLAADQKVLIVLDQFEQWLHSRHDASDNELIESLRQCDGGRVQCLVLVRDDFYFAVNRFFQRLEVLISEGHNYALVDLFDLEHARKVLIAFGRAYGKLPDSRQAFSREQTMFLDRAIADLAEDGKVISIRLALFADMMKGRSWTADSLRQVGGMQGVGVTFLDETFAVATAPPTHRVHQRAARNLLKALLPDIETDIKGRMQPMQALLERSGYSHQPDDFRALLSILEADLRLIAPTQPEGGSSSGAEAETAVGVKYYQLTHDFLVPTLREWLTRKQRETRRGRAELLLEALSANWNARPQSRRLPTALEWLRIRLLTQPRTWTAADRRMMASADRRHLSRWATGMVLAVCLLVAGAQARRYLRQRHNDERAQALLSQLLSSDVPHLPAIVAELESTANPQVVPWLRATERSASASDDERFRARLFLAPLEAAVRPLLVERLLTASPEEHEAITTRLESHAVELRPALWARLLDDSSPRGVQLRAAVTLARLDPKNAGWRNASPQVASALLHIGDPDNAPRWIERLSPVGPRLVGALVDAYRQESTVPAQRRIAASALARYLRGQPRRLAELLLDATSDSFPVLLSELQSGDVSPALAELHRQLQASHGDGDDGLKARRRAIAAIALLRLGAEDDFWRQLQHDQDPDFRTAIIDRCFSFGVEPGILLARLQSESAASSRQAILLALAEYATDFTTEMAQLVRTACLACYHRDADSGVHFAAEWLLGRIGASDELLAARRDPARSRSPANWLVIASDISLVIVRPPHRLIVGSPATEPRREDDLEAQHAVELDYPFAIGAHEINLAQFERYVPQFSYATAVTPSRQCPVSNATWYDAVKFCRLLSEGEGIAESEMCYPPVAQIGPSMQIPPDWQKRTGYRLPSEAEWECACRAGTHTARFFGRSAARLSAYARYIADSEEHLWPVGGLRPNPWGLFDVYGNVLEWCQDEGKTLADVEGRESNWVLARALRSGTYRSVERENRSSKRYLYEPSWRYAYLGLRIARTLPSPVP